MSEARDHWHELRFSGVIMNNMNDSSGCFLLLFLQFLRDSKIVPGFDQTRDDFAPYGFTCVRWTPSLMPRPDRHNEIELNLLERGTLTYLLGGARVTLTAGRLGVFWAGVPHQIVHLKEVEPYFVATIPLVWFLHWRLSEPFVRRIMQGETIMEPDSDRLPADRALFLAWLDDFRVSLEERRRICLLEMEARLRRLALAVVSNSPSSPQEQTGTALVEGGLNHAERMVVFVAQHYSESLTMARIAQAAGLHPNYAMNVFRRTFGVTLMEYVTQHRLSHAQRLLVTSHDLILNLALDSGFGSLSRFNEAFRSAFGCTPREYRKQHFLG
jgi:AraC family transcriptional regulator, melibiose operon regulatory protein